MEEIRVDISSLWFAIIVLAFFLWRTRRQVREVVELLEQQQKKLSELKANQTRPTQSESGGQVPD